MNKIALFSLLASLFVSPALSGCSGEDGQAGRDGLNGTDGDDGLNGQNGNDGKDGCNAPDPVFWLILRDYQEAERYSGDCRSEAIAYRSICPSAYQEDYEGCQQAGGCNNFCDQQYNLAIKACNKYAAWRFNKTIGRLCGAKILDYVDNGGTAYSVGGNKEDTDGDGIPNFVEYQLMLNPCSPNSYGSCVSDAELDGDFDGVPNGVDPSPYCNPDDPENFSDCILNLIHNYSSDLLAPDALSAVTVYVRKIGHT